MIEAFVTNLGKYNEGELCGEWFTFPATMEQVRELFVRIGVDGVVYEEFFITDYETEIDGLRDCFSEYESIDELNYLAELLDELSGDELKKFNAAVELGDDSGSIKDLINLTQNLDCYDFIPGVDNEGDLGYCLIDDYGMLEIPDHISRYFDYEAYGRDYSINEGGAFTGGGYITRSYGRSIEHYDGREDIPEEYRIFSYPDTERMNMRERMAMYGNMVTSSDISDKDAITHNDR